MQPRGRRPILFRRIDLFGGVLHFRGPLWFVCPAGDGLPHPPDRPRWGELPLESHEGWDLVGNDPGVVIRRQPAEKFGEELEPDPQLGMEYVMNRGLSDAVWMRRNARVVPSENRTGTGAAMANGVQPSEVARRSSPIADTFMNCVHLGNAILKSPWQILMRVNLSQDLSPVRGEKYQVPEFSLTH